jgi:hypothetical protein
MPKVPKEKRDAEFIKVEVRTQPATQAFLNALTARRAELEGGRYFLDQLLGEIREEYITRPIYDYEVWKLEQDHARQRERARDVALEFVRWNIYVSEFFHEWLRTEAMRMGNQERRFITMGGLLDRITDWYLHRHADDSDIRSALKKTPAAAKVKRELKARQKFLSQMEPQVKEA